MTGPSFDKVVISVKGHQTPEARFGRQSLRDRQQPIASSWRCNLTALSQCHNLYFAAYNEYIHVYTPQFPTQTLPIHSQLIVASQFSSPGSRGRSHIDPSIPHSINRLVVELLGNEEVLAVVRDDGDVDAFWVRHISQAIEKRKEPGTTLTTFSDDVKPFFKENVGSSAWGLAIHSQARILATSSNNHEVRIFKFGLLNATDESNRQNDTTSHIVNGRANIPFISFCNTGDDPEGRWLLTTDINGICRCIDLRHLLLVQACHFGRPPLMAHGFDLVNAGWTVTFLDRRSFFPVKDMTSAVGNGSMQGDVWEIDSVPEHDLQSQRRPTSSEQASNARHLDSDRREQSSDYDGVQGPQRANADSSQSDHGPTSEPEYDSDFEHHMDVDDDSDLDVLPNPPEPPSPLPLTPPNYAFRTEPLTATLPTPILHTSGTAAYLLQPHFPPTPNLTAPPHTNPPINPNGAPTPSLFTPPLISLTPHSPPTPNPNRSSAFARINLTAHLPSLGLVVIASQAGHATLCALSKFTHEGRTVYGMRVVGTLPLEGQERPGGPLMGVAAGEIWGKTGYGRVVLTYCNHSVLSYEVGRGGGGGAGVEEVVV